MKYYLLSIFLLVASSVHAQEFDPVCYEEVKAQQEKVGIDNLDNKMPVYGSAASGDYLPMCESVMDNYRWVQAKIKERYKQKCNDAMLPESKEAKSLSFNIYGLAGNTFVTLWNKTQKGYTNMSLSVLDQQMDLMFDEVYVVASIIARFPDAPQTLAPPCWGRFKSTAAKLLKNTDHLSILTYGDEKNTWKLGASEKFVVGTFQANNKKISWTQIKDLNQKTSELISASWSPVPISNILTKQFEINQDDLPSSEQLKVYNVLNNMGSFYVGEKSHRILVNGVNP